MSETQKPAKRLYSETVITLGGNCPSWVIKSAKTCPDIKLRYERRKIYGWTFETLKKIGVLIYIPYLYDPDEQIQFMDEEWFTERERRLHEMADSLVKLGDFRQIMLDSHIRHTNRPGAGKTNE